jgi:signal-transduction protein with cAMP-binding, CBS, and nucleotidyltransferase domain
MMLNVAVQMFLPSSDAAASFAWIADAAVLMLKNKIHRIPIVNESNQVVGKCCFT